MRRFARTLCALACALALAPALRAHADDREIVRRAVDYTLASQLRSGLFRYDFDFAAAGPTGEDNVVRQAGTLFALGEYVALTGDRRVEPALRAGLENLASWSLPTGRSAPQRALESLGLYGVESGRLEQALGGLGLLHQASGEGLVVSTGSSYANALSGATALALHAEVSYARATGDARFAPVRAAWTRGLLSLVVPGAGVREHPETLRRSAYFDGESWLALAHLDAAFPGDAAVADVLADLEAALLERYGREPHSSFYHWGARASAVRARATGEARYGEFAERQASWFLGFFSEERARKQNSCSQVEGLASSLAALGERAGSDELAGRLRRRIAAELAHNRKLQLVPGQTRIGFAAGAELRAPVLAEHAGAFLAGPYRPYTRTDLNQHCISAFLLAGQVGLAEGLP